MLGEVIGQKGTTIIVEIPNVSAIKYPVGTELDIDLKKHGEKRSLSANSYFHVLCNKLRQVLRISNAECKNMLITRYGQIDYMDEEKTEPVFIKTNIPPETMRQSESIHALPVVVKDQEPGAYWYKLYRGSHTYDSHEMAILIDGTVEECKLQDIETLTPNELLRLEGYEK